MSLELDRAPENELALRQEGMGEVAHSFLEEYPTATALAFFGTAVWRKSPADTDIFVIAQPTFDRTPEEVDRILDLHFLHAAEKGRALARPDTYAILKIEEGTPLEKAFGQLSQYNIDRDSPVFVVTRTSRDQYSSILQLISGEYQKES